MSDSKLIVIDTSIGKETMTTCSSTPPPTKEQLQGGIDAFKISMLGQDVAEFKALLTLAENINKGLSKELAEYKKALELAGAALLHSRLEGACMVSPIDECGGCQECSGKYFLKQAKAQNE